MKPKARGYMLYRVLGLLKTYLKPTTRWKHGFNSCDEGLTHEMVTTTAAITSTMQLWNIMLSTILPLNPSGAPLWPSKRPVDKVHSFVIVDFVINNNHSQRPCYGPLKLKLRYSNIYYNVISLLLCFGHPPTTIDAVLATIVAGGPANINWT